jgi:hypothetical protein
MTGLDRRLAQLEAGAGIGSNLPVIFVSFVSADGTDPPATRATVNRCVGHRAPGETRETFLERVGTKAKPMQPGGVVVGFLA